jgi:peptidoglycan-associated lipoprotein
MKHVLSFALIGLLVSGCAENPIKEASIEDRALMTSGNAAGAGSESTSSGQQASQAPKSDTASTVALGQTDVAGRPLTGDSAHSSDSGVKTQPLALQDPEARPLTGTDGSSAVSASATDQSGQGAGILKFDNPQVLDPKDPQGPLAQRRLLFDYDSAAIRDEYRELLEAHAQYLKNNKAARLIVQGHADERGSREYNIALGQRRSESVFNVMSLLGVPQEQVEAVSFGEEKPIAEGQDESAWSQNRRAELVYQDE